MYTARITVICEGISPQSELFKRLLAVGVGNIVVSNDISEIQKEIKECLSNKGMTRYTSKERTNVVTGKENYRFSCENILIVVLSSQNRMGATTAAIGMAAWLNSVGATACYVEANKGRHLAMIAKVYEMQEDNGHYSLDGVDYYTDLVMQKKYNFIICDASKDYQSYTEQIAEADILLLCCGTKPYELPQTQRLFADFTDTPAYILCAFVDLPLRDTYAAYLQSGCRKVLFMEYQPELFDGKVNEKLFKSVIKEYIAEY